MENKDLPALPTITWDQLESGQVIQMTDLKGLTKREWFAGMALQGFISNSTMYQGYQSNEDYAKYIVDIADAVLKELSKN